MIREILRLLAVAAVAGVAAWLAVRSAPAPAPVREDAGPPPVWSRWQLVRGEGATVYRIDTATGETCVRVLFTGLEPDGQTTESWVPMPVIKIPLGRQGQGN